MSEPTETSELSADTPLGKFRARGADMISVLLAAWLGLLTYGLWVHMTEARESSTAARQTNQDVAKALTETNKIVADTMQASLSAQRFTACLVATKESDRELQYMQPNSFCKRMSQ